MRGFLIPDIADNTFCVPYYLFYTKYIIDICINRKEFPKPYLKSGMGIGCPIVDFYRDIIFIVLSDTIEIFIVDGKEDVVTDILKN